MNKYILEDVKINSIETRKSKIAGRVKCVIHFSIKNKPAFTKDVVAIETVEIFYTKDSEYLKNKCLEWANTQSKKPRTENHDRD